MFEIVRMLGAVELVNIFGGDDTGGESNDGEAENNRANGDDVAGDRGGVEIPNDDYPIHGVEVRVEMLCGLDIESDEAGDGDIGETGECDDDKRVIRFFEDGFDEFEIFGIT